MITNQSKPNNTYSNQTKVVSYETWDTNTTTWNTEVRTWDEMGTTWTNGTKVSASITNITKPA